MEEMKKELVDVVVDSTNEVAVEGGDNMKTELLSKLNIKEMLTPKALIIIGVTALVTAGICKKLATRKAARIKKQEEFEDALYMRGFDDGMKKAKVEFEKNPYVRQVKPEVAAGPTVEVK